MTPNIDAERARRESAQAYLDLKAHANSEPYRATVKWIEGLLAQTQTYMADCAPEKLARAQVRLQQLKAMRSALVDPGGATTGYLFD